MILAASVRTVCVRETTRETPERYPSMNIPYLHLNKHVYYIETRTYKYKFGVEVTPSDPQERERTASDVPTTRRLSAPVQSKAIYQNH